MIPKILLVIKSSYFTLKLQKRSDRYSLIMPCASARGNNVGDGAVYGNGGESSSEKVATVAMAQNNETVVALKNLYAVALALNKVSAAGIALKNLYAVALALNKVTTVELMVEEVTAVAYHRHYEWDHLD